MAGSAEPTQQDQDGHHLQVSLLLILTVFNRRTNIQPTDKQSFEKHSTDGQTFNRRVSAAAGSDVTLRSPQVVRTGQSTARRYACTYVAPANR